MRVRYLVAVVALLVVAIAMGGAYLLVGPRDGVEDPTAATSPGDVVQAYLDAGNARDLQTMRAIVEDSQEPQLVPGYGEILLRDNMVVDDVEVGAEAPTSGAGTMADGWEQAVRVPVKLHIVQSDGSFPSDDRVTWGYLLVRHHDDEPWQIVDHGIG